MSLKIYSPIQLVFAIWMGISPASLKAQQQIWDTVAFKLNRSPLLLFEDSLQDKLWISGPFWEVDSTTANKLISYNGNSYEKYGLNRYLPQARDIIRYKGSYYYGGAYGLYKWNGDTTWIALDSMDALTLCLEKVDGKLVIGGLFESIAGQPYHGICTWDGQNWGSFYGLDTIPSDRGYAVSSIADIVKYQGEIYAGGNINNHPEFKEIVRWDGQQWQGVGGGLGGQAWINDMHVYKGELYVAGYFWEVGGQPAGHIARWNGQRWDVMGGGVRPSQVYKMFEFKGYLWMVGQFYSAGGIPAASIVRWDGERWCSFSSDFDNIIYAISSFRDTLYIGGEFESIDGNSDYWKVVKLLDHTYTDTCSARIIASNESAPSTPNWAYPNPTSDFIYLPAMPPLAEEIQLFDLQGRQQEVQVRYVFDRKYYEINLSELPKGIYLLQKGAEVQRIWVEP